MLDIEVAGAVAPDAEIAVYFGPTPIKVFTMRLPPQSTIRRTTIRDFHQLGGPESAWTQQSLTHYDQLFQDAATLA